MHKIGTALLLALTAPLAVADGALTSAWLAEGANNRVYLLGSVHLLRESDYPLPAVIDEAYADAETLVMEIDMDDLDPVATQALVNELGMLPDGESLAELMGDEMYDQARQAAAAIDIPLDMLQQSEPWLAAMTVEQMLLFRMGFNPMLGVEMWLTGQARHDGKPIEGFETAEEQLQFLDGLSLQAQREMLLQTLIDSAELQEIMDDTIDAWRDGDTAFIEETMLADMQQYEELNKVIVVDRNHRWTDTIEAMLDDDDDYLVVVGTLHLVGDDGVPRLLEKRGVRIRQLAASGLEENP